MEKAPITDNHPTTLELKNLSFSYPGVPVFQDINLNVQLQGLSQVVGPNGGGKSTLAKLMLGLNDPQVGKVQVLGCEPARAAGSGLIGYVPQHTLFDPHFPIRVVDVVLSGRLKRAWGPYSKEDRRIVQETLEDLGLQNLAERGFSALSGGQRQRVLVARALVGQPKILLLDEPTANIDFESARNLEAYIRTLKDRISVILITHDFDFLTSSVDRVICVNRNIHLHESGQLDADGLRRLFSGHFHALGEAGCQHD